MEKALRRLDGVGNAKVDLKEGYATVLPEPEKSFDPTELRGAITSVGFTPGDIRLAATGKLIREGGELRLQMAGPLSLIVLTGGEKIAELRDGEQNGRRIRIEGRFQRGEGKGDPPLLSVDNWRTVSP